MLRQTCNQNLGMCVRILQQVLDNDILSSKDTSKQVENFYSKIVQSLKIKRQISLFLRLKIITILAP